MALKPLAHKPPAPLPAAPGWGTLATEGEPASVLRLECPERSESLPYYTLTRWTLQPGPEDQLTIYAGNLTVVVRGRDLTPMREALDGGRLASIRTTESRYLPVRAGTLVTDIVITST